MGEASAACGEKILGGEGGGGTEPLHSATAWRRDGDFYPSSLITDRYCREDTV